VSGAPVTGGSPARRRLVAAWATLMALSLVLAILADVRAPSRLSPFLLAGIALVVLAKSWVILAHYLELRSHAGMLNALLALLGTTVVLAVGSFLVTP
jgi:hypothetical protein